MSRTMCEMNREERAEKQVESRYACKKCGETARKEKHLCKPKKIKDKDEE
jgi:hypothetical protein